MKKKILLYSSFLIGIFMIVGCKKTNNSNIVSFTYNYGSYSSGYYEYSIKVENDKTIFSAKGMNGVDLNINKEINKSYLEKLSKIVSDNNIEKWDGFHGNNNDVLDGYNFSINIQFKDGKKISASGYMNYPDNYNETHKVLTDFLSNIK